MNSTFASFRLVLASTSIAARALQALSLAAALSPDMGQLAAYEAVSTLTSALRTVDVGLIVHPDPLPPDRTPKLKPKPVVEVLEARMEDEDWYPPVVFVEQEIRGAKTLLLEVVRRAAYDWVLYRTSRRLLHKKLAEDAHTWLFEEAPGHENWEERHKQGKHITAFLAICHELDLDANVVREYVRRLTIKNVMSVGRPAEYRRRDTSSLRDRPTAPAKLRPALSSNT